MTLMRRNFDKLRAPAWQRRYRLRLNSKPKAQPSGDVLRILLNERVRFDLPDCRLENSSPTATLDSGVALADRDFGGMDGTR